MLWSINVIDSNYHPKFGANCEEKGVSIIINLREDQMITTRGWTTNIPDGHWWGAKGITKDDGINQLV